MTREVVNKLNAKQRKTVEAIRANYKLAIKSGYYNVAAETRANAKTYCNALVDSEILTEQEGRVLFNYTTV